LDQYDYIFLGAGCASLSLLTRMQQGGLLDRRRVLVIDQAAKTSNDRTWCFWEKKPGFFEPVLHKQWEQIWFHSPGFSKKFSVSPYRYKMIRSAAFYAYCRKQLSNTGVEFLTATVTEPMAVNGQFQCKLNDASAVFGATTVFNSLPPEKKPADKKSIDWLQHFKGWLVKTATPVFNPNEAVLMDFRVNQSNGACFVYVLPLDDCHALVEYTLFSGALLEQAAYDDGLFQYMQSNWPGVAFTVEETEFGIIPMTTRDFPWFENGMFQIGTAGGQTKASSGYTFQFIQKQSAAITTALQQGALNPRSPLGRPSSRFRFYDKVLLTVLEQNYLDGSRVFSQLFEKNPPARIFSFLDNETSFPQELALISSLPTIPFLKAAWRSW
jgi:lycopene beta-cyclase